MAVHKGLRGTEFDGSTDYYTRGADLTGNANSKLGLISFWINPSSVASTGKVFSGAQLDIQVTLDTSARIVILGRDTGNTNIVRFRTSALSLNIWSHVAVSWDLANAATHAYVNGSSDLTEISAPVDAQVDYTQTDHGYGSTSAGVSVLNGVLSEAYINFAEYLDLSVASNLLKFIDASLSPVPLGSDGSTPTGNQPIIYFPDGDGTNNLGSGGNFTENGSPVTVNGPGYRTNRAALIYEGVTRGSSF
jgi:hypothetical protein